MPAERRVEAAGAWFESFEGDRTRRWPLTQVIYRDPDTGGLLTVAHGRITRIEFFQIEDLGAALARFAELRSGPAA